MTRVSLWPSTITSPRSTASIKVRRHPGYNRPGPVLTIREIAPAQPPEDEVATFY